MTKKTKTKTKKQKELAEIAFLAYFESIAGDRSTARWKLLGPVTQYAWRASVNAVLEEAVSRMEAKLFKK